MTPRGLFWVIHIKKKKKKKQMTFIPGFGSPLLFLIEEDAECSFVAIRECLFVISKVSASSVCLTLTTVLFRGIKRLFKDGLT